MVDGHADFLFLIIEKLRTFVSQCCRWMCIVSSLDIHLYKLNPNILNPNVLGVPGMLIKPTNQDTPSTTSNYTRVAFAKFFKV